jgi:hypothetical protein
MEAPRLKSPHRRAAPDRIPPAGGPAMMNGVAYQLLWSLLRVWKGTVCDVLEGPTDLEPRGVTVILEPPEGGDLEIPGAVEQIKARSSGGSWSLEEVIQDVLPDLYKAYRTRERAKWATKGETSSPSTAQAISPALLGPLVRESGSSRRGPPTARRTCLRLG